MSTDTYTVRYTDDTSFLQPTGGWVFCDARGHEVGRTRYATEGEARAAADELVAADEATRASEAAARGTSRPVASRQAQRVARLAGLPAPTATDGCHYCGQRLDRRGRCDECN